MKIIIIAGARPNFMKIAPLIRAIEKYNDYLPTGKEGIEYILVHTGQHYDIEMSEVFFRDLDLPKPDVNLEVGSGSHAVQTANILIRFEEVCLREKPYWVLVVGDVNSTMACALVAAKLGIKVGHVEAGLRSYDRTMPEELNRVVTDALADLLFTPSPDADENLIREGVTVERIKYVGNIMIDTLIVQLEKARQRKTYEKFGLTEKAYALVTLHRPANIDDINSLLCIMNTLKDITQRIPIIFPVHPRTKKKLAELGFTGRPVENGVVKLINPLGYHDFISIVEKAQFVLTDSGGLQEETTFLGIPCLTLRPNTERPITIKQGTNMLTSLQNLKKDVDLILSGKQKKGIIPARWDGLTGQRIIDILANESKPHPIC
ncbi:UDP-N-acetylglucosamine 2-epimerase (non-hydrolyzing) [bacterium]|nr:UDP-N-acetylglucosamine 2-epimerase (non-hydrolyzing) [bacterium]